MQALRGDGVQTCGGAGLSLLGCSTRRGQPGALACLTQHIADGVDFGAVVAVPGGGADWIREMHEVCAVSIVHKQF